MTQYRELTNLERWRANNQPRTRSIEERWAYWYLPRSMQKSMLKNHAVAFESGKAYYPDLILLKEKIIIEIDGGYHNNEKQQVRDEKRDHTFFANDFCVIRIKNEDTCVNVAFWERLIEQLSKIEPVGSRATLPTYIDELQAMRDAEIQSWTSLDSIAEVSMANVHRYKGIRNIYEWIA